MSRIGPVLTGDKDDLAGGPPVMAMLIQNTNPVTVAPESAKVRAGFAREDLFVCVHEQFMTETARMADVVLPATTFLEHDDIYLGGGHTFLQVARGVLEPPGECRSNHAVICGLDVSYAIPFLAQLWLFATPVAYPSSLVPEPWRALYGLNPMVGVVEGFRWALLDASQPPLSLLAVSTAATLALLAGGLFYFRRMERTFADVI
jgi:hypothetical protein